MHQSITTVAFFDTLGPDAQMFIIDQTQMATMIVSKDYLKGLANLKISDTKSNEGKLTSLLNIVVFETDGISAEDRLLCEEGGLKVFTLD